MEDINLQEYTNELELLKSVNERMGKIKNCLESSQGVVEEYYEKIINKSSEMQELYNQIISWIESGVTLESLKFGEIEDTLKQLNREYQELVENLKLNLSKSDIYTDNPNGPCSNINEITRDIKDPHRKYFQERSPMLFGKNNKGNKYMLRVGFIVDKFEPIKYKTRHYDDLVAKKDLNDGYVMVDVAIAYYVREHTNFKVDIITRKDITLERLSRNNINYLVGYDLITESTYDNNRYDEVKKIFKNKKSNVWPPWKTQEFIYNKSEYSKYLLKRGIPMAPLYIVKNKPKKGEIDKLIKNVSKKGWKDIIIKPEMGAWGLGIEFFNVKDLVGNPEKLYEYFEEFTDYPSFIIQRSYRGFEKKWEIRLFYFDGEFKYAIGNKSDTIMDGGEIVTNKVSGRDLGIVKKIGDKVMKKFPKETVDGRKINPAMLRMDFGCCLGNTLSSKDYFLNEVENQACHYFTSHLDFDVVPEYGQLFINKTLEIFRTYGG